MTIQEQELLIFANQYGYSSSISKKNVDDEWERTYIPTSFKKDVVVANKTKILVKKGWFSFYKTKAGKTVIYLFVSEFETLQVLTQ